MKLSIITATYNRANMLENVYKSIVKNIEQHPEIQTQMQVQWLIMDDGSTDSTEELINNYIQENKFEIKYHKQENQGKMQAINNIIQYADGDLIMDCDSDDFLVDDAFINILQAYNENKERKDLYGLCFLKYDLEGKNVGNLFKKEVTTMFDLYFKEQEDGEKILVFFANIRKQFHFQMEHNEKFITEARMYHQMDLQYKIRCYNKPVIIGEYQEDGYTKNINKVFKENPYGYFAYFKEILEQHDMTGVPFKKRLYVIKHYILFATLTNTKMNLKEIKEFMNKFLVLLLWIPGKLKTKSYIVKG